MFLGLYDQKRLDYLKITFVSICEEKKRIFNGVSISSHTESIINGQANRCIN